MPYRREGAIKLSDHHIRSPLLDVARACQTCHRVAEQQLLARADSTQSRTRLLMDRAEEAVLAAIEAIVAAVKRGVSASSLTEARNLQRKAQWRLDFVAAENSMGFHAPQESARILAEAIDYARQGQINAAGARP
jgi:nitrite reductase (cytochrome c-552)